VGRVFQMIVISMLHHAEIGRNDHRANASHFSQLLLGCQDRNLQILNFGLVLVHYMKLWTVRILYFRIPRKLKSKGNVPFCKIRMVKNWKILLNLSRYISVLIFIYKIVSKTYHGHYLKIFHFPHLYMKDHKINLKNDFLLNSSSTSMRNKSTCIMGFS